MNSQSMLHILNNSASADVFRETHLSEEDSFIVFDETLSEGPVNPTGMFESRKRFLTDHLFSENEFSEKILAPLAEMTESAPNAEITIWVNNSLADQIKLIYLIWRLSLLETGPETVDVVAVDRHFSVKPFRGFYQLQPEQMAALFAQRKSVSGADANIASELWHKYASPDPVELNDTVNHDFGSLLFLRNAIVAHLERFPSVQNGLNRIEQQILSYIDTGVRDLNKLKKLVIGADVTYGLQSVILEKILKRLAPLLNISETVSLNETGKRVFNEELNFTDVSESHFALGGSHSSEYRWNRVTHRLQPVE